VGDLVVLNVLLC